MKKYLILANSGIGLYLFRGDLIQKLGEQADVVVSVPVEDRQQQLQALGCRVEDIAIDRRGIDPVRDCALLWRYFKLLRREKPDTVITYTIKPNIYGGMLCRLLKIPYAANITGLGTAFQGQGLLRKVVTVLYRTALKKAQVVFFENSANRDVLVGEKIVAAAQCYLLPGAGVNLERYPVADYPGGEVRFLFMGRVMKEKGVGELFEAMERLRSEGASCSLDVLGYTEEDFAAAITEGEKAGWLRYHGYQADVRPFIQNAHCFVLPSYHEGMANTNLECASMARPVITSDIPGCREAVADGESGFLCKPKDADSLYEAMKRFLALEQSQRREMGLAGRKRMEEIFDKRRVVEMTVEALIAE